MALARKPFPRGSVVLAIDQGTTNTKALLFDRSGQIIARASSAVSISFPRPGWVEQDAESIWASVVDAINKCISSAPQAQVIAIGVSNQRESALLWDRQTGQALGPCIVWQCRRTADFCSELRSRHAAALIHQRTGLAVDPLFSATKIRWLLANIRDGFERAARLEVCAGTVDSWLLWKLTDRAVHATDASNASRTQLLNLERVCWDDEIAREFGIPIACLPQVRPSSGVFGHTVATGRLSAGIPIGSLIGDSHAALFGHGAFKYGAVKATYGTGSSLMTLVDGPVQSSHGLSATIAWAEGNTIRYALEGNITNTGGTVHWLGEFLGLPNGAEGVAALANAVEDSGGVHLVPAFAGLGAPYWDPDARAAITGLTRGSSRNEVSRAAVESIAYQIADVFEAMEADAGVDLPELLTDGGASRNDTLMQFQADIIGRPVIRSSSTDISARGAAWLAGLSVEFWRDRDDLTQQLGDTKRFEPRISAARRSELLSAWHDAVSRVRLKPALLQVDGLGKA